MNIKAIEMAILFGIEKLDDMGGCDGEELDIFLQDKIPHSDLGNLYKHVKRLKQKDCINFNACPVAGPPGDDLRITRIELRAAGYAYIESFRESLNQSESDSDSKKYGF